MIEPAHNLEDHLVREPEMSRFEFYSPHRRAPDILYVRGLARVQGSESVWLDRAPADNNNIAGAATRR
jgi:hypothetical protein